MDSRQTLLTEIQSAANAADAAATLVWQVYAWPIDPTDTFNFDWSQPGNQAIRKQISTMKERVRPDLSLLFLRFPCRPYTPFCSPNISANLPSAIASPSFLVSKSSAHPWHMSCALMHPVWLG
jgi:hypothetical protein